MLSEKVWGIILLSMYYWLIFCYRLVGFLYVIILELRQKSIENVWENVLSMIWNCSAYLFIKLIEACWFLVLICPRQNHKGFVALFCLDFFLLFANGRDSPKLLRLTSMLISHGLTCNFLTQLTISIHQYYVCCMSIISCSKQKKKTTSI